MFKEKVATLLETAMEEDSSLFIIEFTISSGNAIKVILDGDQGVDVKACMAVSRAIEQNLDREEDDFSLEVASAGATSPLVIPRQYLKNIGRVLEVRTKDAVFEGQMTSANKEEIILEWKAREPKPIGKGKVTVHKKQEISIADIMEAKVVLKF